MEWKTPAWGLSLEQVNRVTILSLPQREIVPEVGWPETFRQFVAAQIELPIPDALQALHLFQELEPGISRRCHVPPWGLAFYINEALLSTVTLCYLCHNAYVYTANGKELRAFNSAGANAIALRRILSRYLTVDETG